MIRCSQYDQDEELEWHGGLQQHQQQQQFGTSSAAALTLPPHVSALAAGTLQGTVGVEDTSAHARTKRVQEHGAGAAGGSAGGSPAKTGGVDDGGSRKGGRGGGRGGRGGGRGGGEGGGGGEGQGDYSTVFTNSKAGMDDVDKEYVKGVVYRMSKDSPHFRNEQRKTEEGTRRNKVWNPYP